MQRVRQTLNEAIHQHNGTVQHITGDGVMALFGAPIPSEDAPLNACSAALAIQEKAASLSEETSAKSGFTIGFRIGIHRGLLEAAAPIGGGFALSPVITFHHVI